MADYLKDDDGNYECLDCGWTGKRSGYYKHAKKCTPTNGAESTGSSSPTVDESDASPTAPPIREEVEPEQEDTVEDSWASFGADLELETNTTDYIPTPLTIAAKRVRGLKGKTGKLSAKEKQMLEETNLALLNQLTGGVDFALTKFGQYATLDDDFVVKHSQASRDAVSRATWAWMDEQEIYPSMHIGTGTIALALWGYYVAPPVMRIRKNQKKKLLKNGGKKMLGWIPIFGKRFRKPKQKGWVVEDADES